MDPLSQGLAGTTFSQNTNKDRSKYRWAALVGLLSGMAPDLDVLISSDQDPLLALEYHRHFTHSLFFVPFGALICATVFFLLFLRRRMSFKEVYLYSFAGVFSHGILDACTTYGTQLLWPFSNARIAWNVVSIVDPVLTLTVLALLITAVIRKQQAFARAALIFALCYFGLGVTQRERAENVATTLAAERGHSPEKLSAKPSLGNILLWKTVYEFEDRFYVDAVRVGFRTQVFPGDSLAKLNLPRDFPWLAPDSLQARDVQRFAWFSNDFLAKSPRRENSIIDVRYSMVPNQINALWGIRLSPESMNSQHVLFENYRDSTSDRGKELWQLLRGETTTHEGKSE